MRFRRRVILLRSIAAVAALWLLAHAAVRAGVGRARMERILGERLGLDVTIGRTRLRGLSFYALDVRGYLPGAAEGEPAFGARLIRVSCGEIDVQDANLLVVELPDGSTLPASFASCKPDLDGTASRPCPIRVLTALWQTAWPPSGEYHGKTSVENAAILYRDRESALHPVFTGLDWRRQWFRFTLEPECRRSMYTSARFRSFGPAVAPDGRPTDGGAGSVQWFDRGPQPDGAPSISIVWGKRQPCGEESENPRVQESDRRASRETGSENPDADHELE